MEYEMENKPKIIKQYTRASITMTNMTKRQEERKEEEMKGGRFKLKKNSK